MPASSRIALAAQFSVHQLHDHSRLETLQLMTMEMAKLEIIISSKNLRTCARATRSDCCSLHNSKIMLYALISGLHLPNVNGLCFAILCCCKIVRFQSRRHMFLKRAKIGPLYSSKAINQAWCFKCFPPAPLLSGSCTNFPKISSMHSVL